MSSGQTSRTFAPRLCLALLAFQLLAFSASAQFTKLVDFTGANGSEPWGSLISDGTFLYGMTSLGGTNNIGTIFKVKPDGSGYVKLFDFTTLTGSHPFGSLYYDGTFLYGMTAADGSGGVGSIFKIKPDGTGFVNLLQFNGTNGASPYGAFISDGTFLYGLTSLGGSGSSGTVFKIKPDGTGFATLANLNATVGRFPYGSLFFDGTFLYGMASSGGSSSEGTIFKVKTDGTSFSKIFDFTGFPGGSGPQGSLISDGTFLYGMTESGGASNDGCIFKILPDGSGFLRLTNFNLSTGDSPFGDLTRIGSYFYGMTYSGGTGGTGNLFRVKTDGTGLTTLFDFSNVNNGWLPYGSLFSDGAILYGMTQQGGPSDGGAVFKYQLNIVPTITSFAPTSGPVGTTVTITGTNFDLVATNNTVYFGATRANVSAATPTQLTVTVPFGATYQPISVIVSGLTAFSKVPFLVTFPGGGLINTCSFEAPVFYGSGVVGAGLAIGDLDGDGKTDVVTTDYSSSQIHIFRNTSSLGAINAASFATSIDFAVGSTPQRVTMADIDGDGKLDIVVPNYGSNAVSVFRNISTPGSLTVASFSPKIDLLTNVGSGPFNVVCRDLDGDGKTDIAVSNAAQGAISIWRNIGSSGSITPGSFATRLDIAGPGTGLAIEDIDGDGKPDLVAGYNLGTAIGIARNFSTPGALTAASFLPFVNFTVGAWPEYIVVGDLDSDNRPDIVTSSWPDNSISVLKNTSTPGSMNIGSLAPQLVLTGPNTEPHGVALSDFDGDGLLDIGLSKQTGVVHIYRNANTPGAINTGSFLTPIAFGSTGSARDLQSGDIDGDGKPELVTSNFSAQSFSVMRNIVRAGPIISGFSPTSGSVGTTVTITGTNFSTTLSQNVVSFNGTAGFVIGATTTSLTVVVPPGATTGPINVTVNCNGPVTSGASFTVTPIVYNTCSAITLNSATDYIQVATNPSLEPSSITIEVLVNFAIPPPFSAIVSKPYQTNVEDSYAIWYQGGNLMAGVRLGGGLAFPWSPTPGQWYHIALTYNSLSNSEILYVDGAPVAAGTALPPLYDSHDFLIGADINNGTHDLFFNGQIDEVRLWNVQRSQVEILTNLTSSLSGNEPGLVSYYRINGPGVGTGISVPNSATVTGATNNGVTVGTAATPFFTGSCSCVPVAERNGLIALYNSTAGAGWANKTNWLGTDESTWFGVTVSGCHVVELALPTNNLVGTLPPELGNLTSLTNLNLFNNHLTDVIPATIGNMASLTQISLSFNQLYGSIPPEIGNLSNLTILDLAHNQLYDLPPEIWNLTSLQRVQLSLNQMGGILPPEIGNLTGLVTFNIDGNYFYGNIPAEIGNLTQLTHLKLDHNFFEGALPPEIGNLVLLRELQLSNNYLDGAIPVEIGNLGVCDVLTLDHNLFTDLPDLSSSPLYVLNQNFADITVHENHLTFEDLEPNKVFPLITLGPQAKVPPGGPTGFVPPGPLFIPFTTPGTGNSYQWYKDGLPIPGQTLASLNVASTTGGDVGFYYVRITSSVVTGVTLESEPYIVYTDVCSPVTRTAGDLDTSFDPQSGSSSSFENPAAQSDGKIIVYTDNAVVNSTVVSGLIRFNSDGSQDGTFQPNVHGPAFVIRPDGEIIAGVSSGGLELLDTNGNGDETFVNTSYYNAHISALALQSDGKVLVALSQNGPAYVDRLNADGSNDATFSGPTLPDVAVIRQQADGDILVGGAFPGGISRLNPDGSLDGSFQGIADDYVIDIAVQPDGKIIVVGLFNYFNDLPHSKLVRLNADGSIDNTFNAVGITDNIEFGSYPNKIAIQPDGKIILAGLFETINGTGRSNLIRLHSDGRVDCYLDPEASTETSSDVEDERITGLMLQADGKIVITGAFEEYENVPRLGLARVNNILGIFPPVISSFTPANGPTGTTVNIVGTNFDAALANNIVYFGATRANVTAATATQLTVTVPTGATFQPITVTVNGLTAISSTPFLVTFPGGVAINACALSPKVDFTTAASNSESIVTTDFDGDGKPDFALSMGSANILSTYINTSTPGNPSLGTRVDIAMPSAFTRGIATGDIDGDGKPDLVTTNWNLSNLSILRNTSSPGAITFAPKVDVGSGLSNHHWVAVGDIDGDGKLDLVVPNNGTLVSVFRNLSTPGSIAFAAKLDFTVGSGTTPWNVAVTDLDGDSKPDLAVTVIDAGASKLSILRNTSTASVIAFDPFVDFTIDSNPYDIRIGDLDGDLKPDIAVVGFLTNKVSVLRNTSTPGVINSSSFAAKVDFFTSSFPISLRIDDFNGDGKPDLVAGQVSTASGISIFMNAATPGTINSASFAAPISFPTGPAGPGNYDIATGDIDGDGKSDISLLNNKVSVFLNSVVTNPPTITSFTPTLGSIGTPVTLTGTNFSTLPANNIVLFNGSGAAVTASTATSITTSVPVGATTGPIQVTLGCITVVSSGNFTVVPTTITITQQPADAIACEGATANFVTAAAGTTNIAFQWQFSPDGIIPFVDISNSSGYSNVSTSTLSVNTTLSFGAGRYRCRINGDFAPQVITNDEGLFINLPPIAPGTSGNSGCASTSILLSATGGSAGEFRWYTVAVGGAAIAGAVNNTFATPSIAVTTNYYVAINNGTCESTRTSVTATVIPLPISPSITAGSGCLPSASVILNASGGSPGEYRWYSVATGGSPIAGETNSSYVTPTLSATTTFYVSINNGICESLRVPVDAQIRDCTPVITAATAQTPVGSSVSINIALLVTIISDPIDLSSIKVITQPSSGAIATIVAGILEVNYDGVSFAGTDHLTIEACDLAGHCAQKEITIEVVGDITIFNAVSPNGDGKNDTFIIQYIEALPETQKNNVTIFNRWGTVVYEVADYNNSSNVFKGLSNSGDELPSGTYYYTIEFSSGATKRNGFISLRR